MLRLAACSRLRDELLREGIGVALPIGSRELDLLASVEACDDPRPSAWIPIKVVAVHADELNASLENVKASGLVIALVCKSGKPDAIRAFAFTPAELIVVKMIALIEHQKEPRPGRGDEPAHTRETALRDAIERFAVAPGQWRNKLATMLKNNSRSNA